MKHEQLCLPEGARLHTAVNRTALSSLSELMHAFEEGLILEAVADRCTSSHDLLFDLGWTTAVMPRAECAPGLTSGETREIAVLSRVGKPVCFRVAAIDDSVSPPAVMLSRREVMLETSSYLLDHLLPGEIIHARVTHIEPFGLFVDIGCGVVSMIGVERLSVSRIFHPSERFSVGQELLAVVRDIDRATGRINLSHRELLGTWEENAALFSPGETVRGIVRSVESYGVFIELTPNLSGLAERRTGLREGQTVSVFVKSILPERMKLKLNIIDILSETPPAAEAPHYFLSEGRIDRWIYTPCSCTGKLVETNFTAT